MREGSQCDLLLPAFHGSTVLLSRLSPWPPAERSLPSAGPPSCTASPPSSRSSSSRECWSSSTCGPSRSPSGWWPSTAVSAGCSADRGSNLSHLCRVSCARRRWWWPWRRSGRRWIRSPCSTRQSPVWQLFSFSVLVFLFCLDLAVFRHWVLAERKEIVKKYSKLFVTLWWVEHTNQQDKLYVEQSKVTWR